MRPCLIGDRVWARWKAPIIRAGCAQAVGHREVAPGHSGGVRLGDSFHLAADPLRSDLSLVHSFSSSVQTSPPWGLVPKP